jgi:hypothetical protein
MTASPPPDDGETGEAPGATAGLWPSAHYDAQVEGLRAAVGTTVYVAELRETETRLGVQITDHAYELLGVVDFPRPDPGRGLAPHLIVLDDGRGVNLGRIARISRRPFQPTPDEVLYLDHEADRTLLFADRRLSKTFIGGRARAALSQVLGYAEPETPYRLEDGADQAPADPNPEAGTR